MMTQKIGRLFLSVEMDESPESPREWDNFGTMVCFHSRYKLGDEHSWESPDAFLDGLAEHVSEKLRCYDDDKAYDHAAARVRSVLRKTGAQVTPGEFHSRVAALCKAWRDKIRDKALDQHYIILPLYLYDHSGITMNTTGFSCRWDSGQVGYIYVEREKILKEYGGKKLTKKLRERAAETLRSEVAVYDQYLRGDCWCCDIVLDGEADESCGGYFGEEYATLEGLDSLLHSAFHLYGMEQEWVWDSAQKPEDKLARWEGWLVAADIAGMPPELYAEFEDALNNYRGAAIALRKEQVRSQL